MKSLISKKSKNAVFIFATRIYLLDKTSKGILRASRNKSFGRQKLSVLENDCCDGDKGMFELSIETSIINSSVYKKMQ